MCLPPQSACELRQHSALGPRLCAWGRSHQACQCGRGTWHVCPRVVGFLGARSKGLGCSRQPVRCWCSWIEGWHGAQPPWAPRGSHLAGVVWGLCRGGGKGWGLPEEAGLSVPDLLLAWNPVHPIHREKPFLKSTALRLGTGISSEKCRRNTGPGPASLVSKGRLCAARRERMAWCWASSPGLGLVGGAFFWNKCPSLQG